MIYMHIAYSDYTKSLRSHIIYTRPWMPSKSMQITLNLVWENKQHFKISFCLNYKINTFTYSEKEIKNNAFKKRKLIFHNFFWLIV